MGYSRYKFVTFEQRFGKFASTRPIKHCIPSCNGYTRCLEQNPSFPNQIKKHGKTVKDMGDKYDHAILCRIIFILYL